ncbi:MAG: hypothetical protein ACFFER_15340 [Candidatus Thorarchaeota archaeon]
MVRIPIDKTHEITLIQSIELPFWIPIKSGEYKLPKNKKIKVRNDLWLISTANIVDDSLDLPYEFIVDEIQVSDNEYLERITEGRVRYFHKRKMKSTIIRSSSLLPFEGVFSAEPGSDEWKEQVQKTVLGSSLSLAIQGIIDDTNEFIDYYSTLIGMNHQAGEMRPVSSYETVLRIFATAKVGDLEYSYPTKIIPDYNMIDLPFPLFCICNEDNLALLRHTLESIEEPSFHQLQWIRTLNHMREKRYQEALLSAALTFEALAYNYLEVKGLEKKEGLSKWVTTLTEPMLEYFPMVYPTLEEDKVEYWVAYTCDHVAKLWRLRNRVVHERRILERRDSQLILEGITSLGNFRTFILNTVNPELLDLEKKFASILEPVQIDEGPEDPFSQTVTIKLDWRRELDCYQNPVTAEFDDGDSDEASE